MGSFSELVLSFDFREDTPDEVLAAFSALEQPHPDAFSRRHPAPPLPAPVREPSESWMPDWRALGGPDDEFEAEPWRHNWAPWLNQSQSVSTVPSAALVWKASRWDLTCRCAFKLDARSIFEFIEWLGPWIEYWEPAGPRLVGYIGDEADPRPFLLWVSDGRLLMEDLNALNQA